MQGVQTVIFTRIFNHAEAVRLDEAIILFAKEQTVWILIAVEGSSNPGTSVQRTEVPVIV